MVKSRALLTRSEALAELLRAEPLVRLDLLVLGVLAAARRGLLGGTESLVRLDLLGLLDLLFALFLHGFPPIWKIDRCPQDGEWQRIFPPHVRGAECQPG